MRLTVSDDGVGLPPGFDQTSRQSLGLKLVAALSDQLRATFSLENRSGAFATLLFRLTGAAPSPARAPDSAASD
jgi:two-component sensor histidine kinase